MDRADFHRMFNYDHWANRECLKAMRAGGTGSEKILGRMAHVLSAEKLWLERIVGQKQSLAVWPSVTLAECEALADEMASAWRGYLDGLAPDAFKATVDYRNSKGEPWSSRVEDILLHVVMHSMYHRGQIALEMRAAGVQPAYTDFIHAVRQGFISMAS